MKLTKIAKIEGGQDGAIYGNYLFRFDTEGNCRVYETKSLFEAGGAQVDAISAFSLDKVDILMPHSNAVSFGREFFEEGDEFPLLYTNIYNSYAKEQDKMKGVCAVYRLTRRGTDFETKLVQIIEIGFVEDTSLWASEKGDVRPFGNFTVDVENGIYYGFTMRDTEEKTRYFSFELPKLCDGAFDEKFGVKRVVLEKEDIKEQFDCDYHRYIQGAICCGGKIYSLEGFTDDPTNVPAMRVIDPKAQKQEKVVLFPELGTTAEPEFVDFSQGICVYGDGFGNLYTIDLNEEKKMYNGFTYPLAVTDGNRGMIAEVEEAAKKLFDKEIISLPYTAYRLFSTTGSRVEYEEYHMEHRKMLCAFCAMVLLDKGEEWLDRLCDTVWAVCDEYTWALPAHLTRCKTPQDIVSCIDLFASETAFALAEIHYLLRDKLPQEVKDRIEFELDRRIIAPYLEKKPRWGKSNWSGVCASGVGAAFIYLGLDEKFARAKEQLLLSLEDFLESFPDDGCCLEGSLYWFYGFSHFCYIAQLLFEYTNGEINYFADEKVKRIAFFCNNMYLEENFCIPFSDSPHTYNYNPGILHLLAEKYEGIVIPPIKYAERFENSARYRFATFLRNLYYSKSLPEKKEALRGVTVYPDSAWYINRRNSYIFAAKAGHNDEPHNHNDVGSFLVFDKGRYILDDAGWAKYDSKYFDVNERYSGTSCTTSLGHSLPVIDGQAQKFGKEFCGKVFCADEDAFCIEYSQAYGLSSLERLERSLFLEEKRLIISDKAQGSFEKLVCRFTTTIKPQVCGDSVRIDEYALSCLQKADIHISYFDFEPRFAGFGIEKAGETRVYIIDFDLSGKKEAQFVLEKNT